MNLCDICFAFINWVTGLGETVGSTFQGWAYETFISAFVASKETTTVIGALSGNKIIYTNTNMHHWVFLSSIVFFFLLQTFPRQQQPFLIQHPSSEMGQGQDSASSQTDQLHACLNISSLCPVTLVLTCVFQILYNSHDDKYKWQHALTSFWIVTVNWVNIIVCVFIVFQWMKVNKCLLMLLCWPLLH